MSKEKILPFHPIQSFFLRWTDLKIFNDKSFSDIMILEKTKKNNAVSLADLCRGFFSLNNIPKPFFKNVTKNKVIRANILPKFLSKAILHNELRKIRHFRNKAPNTAKSDVLFLTFPLHFHENSIFRIQPILNALKNTKKFNYDIIVGEITSNWKYGETSTYSGFYSYIDDEILKKAKSDSKIFHKKYKDIPDFMSLIIKEYPDGIPEPKHDFDFKASFEFFLSKDMIMLMLLYYYTALKIVKLRSVKVVCFTGISSLLERSFVTASYHLGSKSVLINHSIIEVYPDDFSKAFDKISKVIVLIEREKKELIEKKILDSNRIYVSGKVIFDEVVPYLNSPSPSDNSVIIATTPFVEENFFTKEHYLNILKKIISTILKHENSSVCIKLHPRDNIQKYLTLQSSKVRILPGNISRVSFYREIVKTRIFLHFCSTSIYEAMLVNRPIITLDPGYDNTVFGNEYNKKKSSIYIKSIENIDYALNECIKNEKNLKLQNIAYVKANIGKVDGKSSKRLIEFVSSLISGKLK